MCFRKIDGWICTNLELKTNLFLIFINRFGLFKMMSSQSHKCGIRVKFPNINNYPACKSKCRVFRNYLFFASKDYIHQIDTLSGIPTLTARVCHDVFNLDLSSLSVQLKHRHYLVIKRRLELERIFDENRSFWENSKDSPHFCSSSCNIQFHTSSVNLVQLDSITMNSETKTLDLLCNIQMDNKLDFLNRIIPVNMKIVIRKLKKNLTFSFFVRQKLSEKFIHYMVISVDMNTGAVCYQFFSLPLCLDLQQVAKDYLTFDFTLKSKETTPYARNFLHLRSYFAFYNFKKSKNILAHLRAMTDSIYTSQKFKEEEKRNLLKNFYGGLR